jgi:hypothetical protein
VNRKEEKKVLEAKNLPALQKLIESQKNLIEVVINLEIRIRAVEIKQDKPVLYKRILQEIRKYSHKKAIKTA